MDESVIDIEIQPTETVDEVAIEDQAQEEYSVSETPSPGRMTEEMKNALREKGCTIFSFGDAPPGGEEAYVRSIKEKITYFTDGLLSEDELNTLADQWPRKCDIAIPPDRHLTDSNYQTSRESGLSPLRKAQLQMLHERGRYAEHYPGVDPMIGSAPLYMAIESMAKEQNGKGIFGDEIIRTATTTRLKNMLGEEVGKNYVFFNGDVMDRIDSEYGDENMFVVPLLISPPQ